MYKIYEVMPGDNLENIARQMDTTVENLRKINGFTNLHILRPGDKIVVPVGGEQLFQSYAVRPGDTIYAIAKKFNINHEDLLKLNGLNADDYIYPEQEILVPKPDVKFIITKEGDTLQHVADELGTNLFQVLMQKENIYLRPDQLLVIKKEEM